MRLYDLFRKLHLYSAFTLLTFLLMYTISGTLLIHRDWFPATDPIVTVRTEPLDYTGPEDTAALALHLQETFDLRGKRRRLIRRKDGSWQFRFARPGTLHEAVVSPGRDRVHITVRQESWQKTLAGFHEMHGYGGGRLYDLWAVLYDLASVSLIVFALTSIYLWHRLTRKRLLGWVFLGVSYGYAAVTILYLMYAP